MLTLFPHLILPLTFLHRYRRGVKYHDKSVNALHVSDNGYIITASLGSKYVAFIKMSAVTKTIARFVKIWKVDTESGLVSKTDVTELQILREHKDYLSVILSTDGHHFSQDDLVVFVITSSGKY